MLAKERYDRILAILHQKKAISVAELTDLLKTSESTIRRDLNELDALGKLEKVHGGAIAKAESETLVFENELSVKYQLNMEEKVSIARYAASLIQEDDFVYLDSGTTTEMMVDFLVHKDVVYITNGLSIARKLAANHFKTYIVAGCVRRITEAVVGSEAEESLSKYHFTKGFFGTNGIAKEGYTTPNIDEAKTKSYALHLCQESFMLADSSKFEKISPVCFGKLHEAAIITTKLVNTNYHDYTKIVEVDRS